MHGPLYVSSFVTRSYHLNEFRPFPAKIHKIYVKTKIVTFSLK